MQKRLIGVAVTFAVLFSILYMRIYVIVCDEKYTQAAAGQSVCRVEVGSVDANIYDRNFLSFVNNDTAYYAAINPTAEAAAEILPHVTDTDEYYSQLVYGSPFSCQVDSNEFESSDITVFEIPERYGENQLAPHVIGYVCDGTGVTGIESAYDEFLRSRSKSYTVTYGIDGQGSVLQGIEETVTPYSEMKAGVVLTLDKYIQAICELAGSKMEKGAVVVMDIRSGDILGMASFPSFSADNLGEALENEDSPLINRCLYSYNVGSIFKLVTALAAFEQGIDESFSYSCTGSETIGDQVFMCHDHSGHGSQDMAEAMKNSCNTYFIKLSERLDTGLFYKTAQRLGFGVPVSLALGINSSGGNLPTGEELEIPAEKANFSFGQGKLLATPLQICAMTAAIANEGKLYVPRLVKGTTEDGENITREEEIKYTQVFDRDTAFRLQDLMIGAVNGNPESNARPGNTRAAGKTSTAQTGLFDENGEEICHGWITGFFPLSQPEYAVTVLCEGGGYGNECAAPVFKEIAERITDIYPDK
ncbi:MAG: peptidoglycan D,D-transpeptidase FtsI family protein [Porcipelethomonas sp.]